jgi:CMP/dCMP kinase
MKGFAIAIDGPVAAGKGTIAPVLAKKLNGVYLDTGAMYRSAALYCLRNNIDLSDIEKVEEALLSLDIDMDRDQVFLNGEDVTKEIRTKEIDTKVIVVAGTPKVREILIPQQKKIAEKVLGKCVSIVVEGRDIATKVIPNADLKVFLTADIRVRAERRLKQKEEAGSDIDFEKLIEDIKKRDKQDIEINKTLVSDPEEYGYFVLDNTNLTEEETVEEIISELKKRGLYDSN